MPTFGLSAVILAGGKSSRMGQDKALMKIKGGSTSWLEHTYQVIQELPNIDEIGVSGHPRDGYLFNYVPDIALEAGPLGGVFSVFTEWFRPGSKLKCDAILFLPVDMPFLSAGSLEAFLKSSMYFIVKGISTFHGEAVFPIVLVTAEDVRDKIVQQIERGEYSLKKLLSLIPSHSIELDQLNGEAFKNINTALEWGN